MKNSKTKEYITWALLLVVAVLIYGYTQLGWFNSSSYLLSVTAEEGAIIGEQDANGCFDLTLKGTEHILWFSDRPERTAFSTDVPHLLSIWRDEFGSNPPNADLQLFRDGSDAVAIITLESIPVWNGGARTLVFDKACPIELVGEDSSSITGNTFSKAVLFIDSIAFDFGAFMEDYPQEGGVVEMWSGCRQVEVHEENLPVDMEGYVYPIEYGVECGEFPVQRIEIDYGTSLQERYPETANPFTMNSCSSSDSPFGVKRCLQEQGSYNSNCGTLDNVQYNPGKSCRAVCDKYSVKNKNEGSYSCGPRLR